MRRALITAGFVAAWAMLTGHMDQRDAEITAQHERAAREAKFDLKPSEYVSIRSAR